MVPFINVTCTLLSVLPFPVIQNTIEILVFDLIFFSAHESFKLCIVEESKECPCSESNCRDDENTETASHFAKVIMENSLGFLLKQCTSQG